MKHEPWTKVPDVTDESTLEPHKRESLEMNQFYKWLAIAFWFASLPLPTASVTADTYMTGFILLCNATLGAVTLPYSLLYPGHLISYATNFLVLRAMFPKPVSMELIGSALVINLLMAFWILSSDCSDLILLSREMLSLPGFYAWLTSFFLLFIARTKGPSLHRKTQAMQATRLFDLENQWLLIPLFMILAGGINGIWPGESITKIGGFVHVF